MSESDSDYIVQDLSKISEESNSVDENKEPPTKRKKMCEEGKKRERKCRLTKKRSWSTPERTTVRQLFQQYLAEDMNEMPSLETCQQFMRENKFLKHRTPAQVRSWVVREEKIAQ